MRHHLFQLRNNKPD